MGAAYDLFGNGKTSLKVNISKYLQAANNDNEYTINNPAVTYQTTTDATGPTATTTRSPDCDLMNPAAAIGECCGAWVNSNFGNPVQTTRVNPDVLHGWGVRPYDWQFGVGVQQQIAAARVGGRQLQPPVVGQLLRHRQPAHSASDFDTATITAPANPALADDGYTTVTFPVISAAEFGVTDNYYTIASDYGDTSDYWHGVDFTVNARTRNGITFQGGTSTGAGVRDLCEVTAKLPETLLVITTYQQVGACKVDERWLTSARGLVSYTIPKVGRARQRVGPLDGERPAVDNQHIGGHQRCVAVGQLQRDERGRAGGDRTTATRWCGGAERRPHAAWPDLRRPHQRSRHALRESLAVRTAREPTSGSTSTTSSTRTPERRSIRRSGRTARRGCGRRRSSIRGSFGST